MFNVNFDALRILIASLRPIFMMPKSTAVSTAGRPLHDQYRNASGPYSSTSGIGVTTLPFDFDIFLRSGSSTHPLIVVAAHGNPPCSKRERTTVSNNHVRMISGPCGRRSIGNVRSNRSGSSSHPVTICGVSDEVAHVSMTSGSSTKPPGRPRWSAVKPGGRSEEGSTGRSASAGTIGSR